MTTATTGQLLRDGRQGGSPVIAFNAINLEMAEAIVDGAESVGLPVIVQISENAIRYHGSRLAPFATGCLRLAVGSASPVALHLDHIEDERLVYQVVACGFGSVMIDASRAPYDENVATTARVVRWAHENGVHVEAELGEIGGKDGAHAAGARTDPAEAADFVARTGVDALAVAVGSSHAMTARTTRLDHALIAALAERLPVPLVLHGSSGVPDDELRAAVRSGIVKINIGTLLGTAFSTAVRHELAAPTSTSDPRRYLAAGRLAVRDVVAATLSTLCVTDEEPAGVTR